MNKIAITGASGFMGKYLVEELRKDDSNELFLFSRSLEKLKNSFGASEQLHFIETDYSTPSLKKIFIKYNSVIHLAGKRFQKNTDKLSDYFENITISENILNACLDNKIKNIVFASTRAVYSPQHNNIPFRENDDEFPLNNYGLSKLICEKIFLRSDINVKILRFAQLIGWGEREGFMLMTFINNAIKKNPITIFGNGQGKREYLYIKDAVSAIISSLRKTELKGIYNTGSGIKTSSIQLAKIINEVFADGESQILFHKNKPEDTSVHLMSNQTIRKNLNWQPKYDLKSAFEDMKISIKLKENYQ